MDGEWDGDIFFDLRLHPYPPEIKSPEPDESPPPKSKLSPSFMLKNLPNSREAFSSFIPEPKDSYPLVRSSSLAIFPFCLPTLSVPTLSFCSR